MKWNPNVYLSQNVLDTTVATEASTSTLLCNNAFSAPGNIPASSSYVENNSVDTDKAVGWTMQNVMIVNALNTYNEDILVKEAGLMDVCLGQASSTNFY